MENSFADFIDKNRVRKKQKLKGLVNLTEVSYSKVIPLKVKIKEISHF